MEGRQAQMPVVNRKERKARAERKKEVIREELFRILSASAKCKNLDPAETVNKAIVAMIKSNPQESHFVRCVCAEMIDDKEGFVKKMLNKEKANEKSKAK